MGATALLTSIVGALIIASLSTHVLSITPTASSSRSHAHRLRRIHSEKMALVRQEPILFDMTIAENIAWGTESPVSMEGIIHAATQANVHSFVTDLPLGYDTRVGERAVIFPAGKQRTAIARALIRKPKLCS
ncbi:P-loop containing nucleoside triphosphate hydrolase protein [Geranomyces variabilis]|nr:P-loop containing nucleoside triphosphate hydrolase protein [Geranomyces variabilis]